MLHAPASSGKAAQQPLERIDNLSVMDINCRLNPDYLREGSGVKTVSRMNVEHDTRGGVTRSTREHIMSHVAEYPTVTKSPKSLKV